MKDDNEEKWATLLMGATDRVAVKLAVPLTFAANTFRIDAAVCWLKFASCKNKLCK